MLLIWHICLAKLGFTTIDVSNFDMKNVENTQMMFYICGNVVTINLGDFNSIKNKTTKSMFSQCSLLQNINFTSFDTRNVENMQYMFDQCSVLASVDTTKFKTEKVANMSYMFYKCYAIESLDLRSFDTNEVTNIYGMFYNCTSLKRIAVTGEKWVLTKVTGSSGNNMFYGCTNIVGKNGTIYKDTSTGRSKTYARIDTAVYASTTIGEDGIERGVGNKTSGNYGYFTDTL